jgi:3-hydroxyacyl-[acyl-carrier-protein] dehydratase
MPMDLEARIQAPLEHPCYSGHFPGNPIVPGVLLLDLVVARLGRGAPRAIGNVKFHRAVKPGETFTLRVTPVGSQVSFRCEHASAGLIAEGILAYGSGA